MNCNQTHFSTHDKLNRTCILEAFTSTYLHVWGLNIESQVQYYGIHYSTQCALLPISSANEPGHAGISGGNLHTAHCTHTAYCKTSMPFRTCIMLSFSQQPKDAEAWIEEWHMDEGERGWRRGSGGGGVRVTGGSVRVSCDRKNGRGFAKLCESSWGHSPLSLLTRVILSVKSLHHTDRITWFEKG